MSRKILLIFISKVVSCQEVQSRIIQQGEQRQNIRYITSLKLRFRNDDLQHIHISKFQTTKLYQNIYNISTVK